MRLVYLVNHMLESLAQERMLLRRLARYVLPLLLLPIGFGLAQMTRGWLGLVVGGFGAGILLAQIELFLRPILSRTQVMRHDLRFYLGAEAAVEPPDLAPAVGLLAPSAAALVVSMALFLPPILASAPVWQRLLALALGAGALWSIWQRLCQIVGMLGELETHLADVQHNLSSARQTIDDRKLTTDESVDSGGGRWSAVGGRREDGLLDPAISHIVAGLPLPALPLSPAARALLRVEAYLLLRDFPGTRDRALLDALAGLANEAHQDELRHWLLPPVGGKLYLPVAANGALAHLLGATVRRLGMEGGYSASLGTWLVRLPPSRSYAVAGRLIDALVALRLPPRGAVLPHHLTIQGELRTQSKVLSIVHLAATPLLFVERSGQAQADERPFIMRGGGVLDNLGGRGRHTGPRTDFVDGFVFAETPTLSGVEHRSAHTLNLRIKQVLAFGLLASARPLDRRSPAERDAALAYARVRNELRDFLVQYGLESALELDWLDGPWSEIWPLIRRMSELKERNSEFLDKAQRLRERALDEIEGIAIAATQAGYRGSIENRR
ncbi:MAG TPA: hypothetical protein VFO07_20870 [Roseiflexaceae bacterium]|nr:hypothetical protein [Roseiflexaceae bacterium]